jgi:hypothetical protein
MKKLLLYGIIFCSFTELINQTKDPWNDFDMQILHKAEKRCPELYPDAPCVKKFYKRPEQSYWVVCGASE